MPQTVTIQPPPPAPAPQAPGRDLGNVIRGAVDDALAGALAPARDALEREIQQMQLQRDALRTALDNAPNRAARQGIQRELSRVENRIQEAEVGLEKLNERLTTHDGPRIAEVGFAPRVPQNQFPDNFNPAPMVIAIMGILFIGFPIALTLSRMLWKRTTNAPPPPLNVETTRRFDRLEQSVDAIAIEVERISENQRYLTRLLGESSKQKLGS